VGLPSDTPIDWALEPCLDLINSRWSDHLGSGHYFDRLSKQAFRRAFLKRWGYRVDDPEDDAAWSRLSELRGVLRPALELYMSRRPIRRSIRLVLETHMNSAPLALGLSHGPDGYHLALQRSGNAWDIVIAEIATSAVRVMTEQRTVKKCANPDCSWMFVDESKPRSRRWCNVSICGSLVNVRRHRARHL
jgi:predicted RNA-binding Zn ribbon-like protein